MKILMVLTSHDKLGNTGEKTGFWLEEFAAPYYAFKDQGAEIILASPKGGQPPLDPKSDVADFQTAATDRFAKDQDAQTQLGNTRRLDSIKTDEFDGVFYPGGHGPLWDLVTDKDSIALIETSYAQNKTLGFVCHASAALRDVKTADGEFLVKGKKVTGFSNSEEDAVGLTDIVPFLLEDSLNANGGLYTKGEDWASYIAIDGKLITGQNPASSEAVAVAMLEQLKDS
jgi:putative intracellular protease/amidase